MTVDEGCGLREAGAEGQILVLGGLGDARDARLAGECALTPTIHHPEGLAWAREAAAKRGRVLPVQLEVDTGMHRMGIAPEAALEQAAEIAADPQLHLDGTFTHFASADSPDPSASLEQIRVFRGFLGALEARGLAPGLVHAANSSALLAGSELLGALPEAAAVRPGLMLYGARSASHEDPARRLRPVMSIRTRVASLRSLAPGEAVGYGSTWRADRPTRVATLPIGYADGVLRSLSNRGAVWLGGERRPIVGRVSMDSVTVAVDDPAASLAVGDPASFFGMAPEGGCGIPVEEQAEAAGTLAYELLVRVGGRLPRIPLEGA
jgi:alanine racemase